MLELFDSCPICYESFNTEDCITFEDCKHKFCRLCTENIVFSSSVNCPLDRCQLITICHSQMKFTIKEHISQYQYGIWRRDQELMLKEMEKYWFESLNKHVNSINRIYSYLKEEKSTYKDWLKRDSPITESEILIFNQTCELRHRYPIVSVNKPPMINILSMIIWQSSTEVQNPTNINIACQGLDDKWNTFSDLYSFTKFNIQPGSKCDPKHILNEGILHQERNLKDLLELRKYVISHVLTYMRNGEELCLVCLNMVDPSLYAEFSECNHKICVLCIRKFKIMHASCPFHSGDIKDLMMAGIFRMEGLETAGAYLASNFKTICDEIFHELTDICIENIKEIVKLKDPILSLVEKILIWHCEAEKMEINADMTNYVTFAEDIESSLKTFMRKWFSINDDIYFYKTLSILLSMAVLSYMHKDVDTTTEMYDILTVLNDETEIKSFFNYHLMSSLNDLCSYFTLRNRTNKVMDKTDILHMRSLLKFVETFLKRFVELTLILATKPMEHNDVSFHRIHKAIQPLEGILFSGNDGARNYLMNLFKNLFLN